MPYSSLNASMRLVTILIWFHLIWNTGLSSSENKHREKRVAILGTTEIPAASVDLSQFNFTDLVNGMLRKAVKGAKNVFSFLSVTSYSSMAFHKVSILIYNISNIKYVDYQKFPMRYCYCLNNRTNDLADYTVLLLDIIGNSTSSLKELFKSTSIVSVSQSNESDCIYLCVMTGRTGRNLSDLWDVTQKAPVVNFTFPKNDSTILDFDLILPNLIMSAEDTNVIMDIPKELWTLKTFTKTYLESVAATGQKISPTITSAWSPTVSTKGQGMSFTALPANPSEMFSKKTVTREAPLTQVPLSKGQSVWLTRLPSWLLGVSSNAIDSIPSKTDHLVGSLVPQKQQESSGKFSSFEQNALKDHSISFSSHKPQEVPYLNLPKRTTIAALELLERPYSVMPLWTHVGSKVDEIHTPKQSSRVLYDALLTQPVHLSRTTEINKNNIVSRTPDILNTVVSTLVKTTEPIKQDISAVKMSQREEIVVDGQNLSTKRPPLPQSTIYKEHTTSSKTFTSLGCLQAKLASTSPSITLVFQNIKPCVMELCRFYQQCLCLSQEQYSRHKIQRHCIQYYSWYLKNATFICETVKRNSQTRTLRQKCLLNICKSI
ncbi:HERV-H LTR-associating protein 1 [Pelobates fuscus]|uniref:HERV-H LTR-associating protein 1 n=1 Tax=Pelobates fuscus TaxID=191477 RepID=UPI002FE4BB2D